MPNYQGSPNNLRKEPPKWKHLPTKAIRVPEAFADHLLASARQLDTGDTERTPEQVDSPPGLELANTERTPGLDSKKLRQARSILTKALKLRANCGGAIKDEIREALELLSEKA